MDTPAAKKARDARVHRVADARQAGLRRRVRRRVAELDVFLPTAANPAGSGVQSHGRLRHRGRLLFVPLHPSRGRPGSERRRALHAPANTARVRERGKCDATGASPARRRGTNVESDFFPSPRAFCASHVTTETTCVRGGDRPRNAGRTRFALIEVPRSSAADFTDERNPKCGRPGGSNRRVRTKGIERRAPDPESSLPSVFARRSGPFSVSCRLNVAPVASARRVRPKKRARPTLSPRPSRPSSCARSPRSSSSCSPAAGSEMRAPADSARRAIVDKQHPRAGSRGFEPSRSRRARCVERERLRASAPSRASSPRSSSRRPRLRPPRRFRSRGRCPARR